MADLPYFPYYRVAVAPPFALFEKDVSGPFIIKQRRNQVNHYGVMFNSMNSRAVRIAITALRDLIPRRENVCLLGQ